MPNERLGAAMSGLGRENYAEHPTQHMSVGCMKRNDTCITKPKRLSMQVFFAFFPLAALSCRFATNLRQFSVGFSGNCFFVWPKMKP